MLYIYIYKFKLLIISTSRFRLKNLGLKKFGVWVQNFCDKLIISFMTWEFGVLFSEFF